MVVVTGSCMVSKVERERGRGWTEEQSVSGGWTYQMKKIRLSRREGDTGGDGLKGRGCGK